MSHDQCHHAALLAAAVALTLASTCNSVLAAMVGSCNNPAGGMCVEYNGAGYKDAQNLRRTCAAQKATFIVGAECPSAGLVGSCVHNKGAALESTYRYYTQFPGGGQANTPEKVAAAGQRQCKPPKGAWTRN